MPESLDENEKVLELQSRRRVYDAVIRNAGSHFREIGRRSGLPAGTVKYHLAYLARHGLIKEERDGNNIRFFPGAFKTGNRKLLSLLRQKPVREIILTVLICDSCNHEQIVKAVRLSPSTVSWHLNKLEEEGVVGARREGRKVFYRLLVERDEIIGLLSTYRESFLDSLVDRVIEMWE